MRNRVVIILAFALLMVFSSVAPVMAAQPTVTDFKAIQVRTGTLTYEKQWFTADNIRHTIGFDATGTVTFYSPVDAATPTYVFNYHNIYTETREMDDINGPYAINVDVEWKYIVDGEVKGTFVGQINWNINPVHWEHSLAHGVLMGTGIFEGQTLRFWEDYQNSGTVWYGSLFAR